jgi:polyphosphate glucokinase
MNILVIDVGGTHVKVLATGQKESREIVSGPASTPKKMVAGVRELMRDWPYDVVAMGYPGPVLHNRPVAEPHNLGPGWAGFNFSSAFKCPIRIVNDAAMQALWENAHTHGTADSSVNPFGKRRETEKTTR